MKRSFTVTLDMPPECTVGYMAEYIQEAVQSMVGSKMPEDPIFELDRESVVVNSIPNRRKKS